MTPTARKRMGVALELSQVKALVSRIESEQGRLDILVNNIWGGDHLTGWDAKLWEHDLDAGLRILRLAIDTHIITSHAALPLLIKEPGGLVIEVTDGDAESNADYRGTFFYDLAKTTPHRIALALASELADHQATAVSLSPGGSARKRCSSTSEPRRQLARRRRGTLDLKAP